MIYNYNNRPDFTNVQFAEVDSHTIEARHNEDPITRDALEDPVLTSCGHVFSRASLTEWLNTRAVCPLDRHPLSVGDIRRIRHLVIKGEEQPKPQQNENKKKIENPKKALKEEKKALETVRKTIKKAEKKLKKAGKKKAKKLTKKITQLNTEKAKHKQQVALLSQALKA